MNVLEMEAYQSEWLSGLDLKGRQVTVIVDAVTAEQVQNQRGEKAVKAAVAFKTVADVPLRKRLLLNKTNAVALARLFGPETNAWKGQAVVLKAENVNAFGQEHCVVRVAGRQQRRGGTDGRSRGGLATARAGVVLRPRPPSKGHRTMTNPCTDELLAWLNGWHADTEAALATAAAVYQDAANRIEQLQAVQAQAKQLITDIFVETGATDARTPTAQVYVSRPSMTVSYDAKALDTLAAGDAEVAELLTPFRRQTERAGTLTIRSLRERAKGE